MDETTRLPGWECTCLILKRSRLKKLFVQCKSAPEHNSDDLEGCKKIDLWSGSPSLLKLKMIIHCWNLKYSTMITLWQFSSPTRLLHFWETSSPRVAAAFFDPRHLNGTKLVQKYFYIIPEHFDHVFYSKGSITIIYPWKPRFPAANV